MVCHCLLQKLSLRLLYSHVRPQGQGRPNKLMTGIDGTPSIQFSHSVMSDSLQHRRLQHARPPCPSPALRVYSNSCPLSQWCHPTISISVIPLSSCLQSFPVLGFFQMSQFFASGIQSIEASSSVLTMNIQDWFPLVLTGWISLQFQGTLKTLLQHHSSKASVLPHSAFFMVQFSHPYTTNRKHSFDYKSANTVSTF